MVRVTYDSCGRRLTLDMYNCSGFHLKSYDFSECPSIPFLPSHTSLLHYSSSFLPSSIIWLIIVCNEHAAILIWAIYLGGGVPQFIIPFITLIAHYLYTLHLFHSSFIIILTHYQTTNFRLVQIEIVCRRQF